MNRVFVAQAGMKLPATIVMTGGVVDPPAGDDADAAADAAVGRAAAADAATLVPREPVGPRAIDYMKPGDIPKTVDELKTEFEAWNTDLNAREQEVRDNERLVVNYPGLLGAYNACDKAYEENKKILASRELTIKDLMAENRNLRAEHDKLKNAGPRHTDIDIRELNRALNDVGKIQGLIDGVKTNLRTLGGHDTLSVPKSSMTGYVSELYSKWAPAPDVASMVSSSSYKSKTTTEKSSESIPDKKAIKKTVKKSDGPKPTMLGGPIMSKYVTDLLEATEKFSGDE